MNRLTLLVLVPMLGLSTFAGAQTSISGEVRDAANGDPLIGVVIYAKGTGTGAVTDVDGKYSIVVPEGASELLFQYTGFNQVTRPIDTDTMIDVEMEIDQSLGDVVVRTFSPVRTVSQFGGPTTGQLEGPSLASTMVPQNLIGLAAQALPDALNGEVDMAAVPYEGEPYIVGFWPNTGNAVAVNMQTGNVSTLIYDVVQDFQSINGVYSNYVPSGEQSAGDPTSCITSWPATSTDLEAIHNIFEFDYDSQNQASVLVGSELWSWDTGVDSNPILNRNALIVSAGVERQFVGSDEFTLLEFNGNRLLSLRTSNYNIFDDGQFVTSYTETATQSSPPLWEPIGEICTDNVYLNTTNFETVVTTINTQPPQESTVIQETGPQAIYVAGTNVVIDTADGEKETIELYLSGLEWIERNNIDRETGFSVRTERFGVVFNVGPDQEIDTDIRPLNARYFVGARLRF